MTGFYISQNEDLTLKRTGVPRSLHGFLHVFASYFQLLSLKVPTNSPTIQSNHLQIAGLPKEVSFFTMFFFCLVDLFLEFVALKLFANVKQKTCLKKNCVNLRLSSYI